MSSVTLRGAVRLKTGVAELGFSRDDEGNGVISWASVPAGMWSYDVFMDDGNEESPLLYGCFISAGRVTPDLPDEQQAVAGAVVVQLPEGSGCVQVVLDNASSAAWYAEQAKKYAENFNLSVDQVTTGDPGTPAGAEVEKGSEKGSYLLSFTIPRGDQGPAGPAGPQGPPGEKGDTGDVNPDSSYNWTQPQTFGASVTHEAGIFLASGQKITLSNGGATIYANANSSIIQVSGLASATGISGNVVNANRVNSLALRITGAATFTSGVTMEQSLNVTGIATCERIEIPGSGSGQISIYSDAGGAALIKPTALLYMGPEYVQNQAECDARYGRIGASNTWSGGQTINGDLTITGIADLGNVRTLNVSLQKTDVHGPASFDYGVTMAQSLNVEGKAVFAGGCDVGKANQLQIYGSGPTGYIKATYGECALVSATDSLTVDFRATLVDITKPRASSLSDKSLLNRLEGDERWIKFNNALTDAQYSQAAAAGTLDATTLYITSDSGKVYIGTYALN